MSILINTISLVAAFCAMEIVAWASHKYIMHGFGWEIHKDHHVPHDGMFQRNDLFFLLFAIPAFLAVFYGASNGLTWLTSLGFGISAYGFCYFLVHDVFIHQRFPWFKRTDNAYFRAIRKAHKIHHKSQYKEDGECFGMLFVPFKYFREARQVN
jgi:beta-carotene 3-hydroxylase